MANIGDKLLQPEEGWERFSDSNPYIRYSSGVMCATNAVYATGTCHYILSENLLIKFKFYGNSFRIIDTIAPDHAKICNIKIDGVSDTYTTYGNDLTFASLVYEKTGLDNGIHEVELQASEEGAYFGLEAIDINSGGYLIAQIGCQLKQPEEGWQRIDDSHPYILYLGETCSTSSHDFYYNKTFTYTKEIKIKFYGTKFRFISGYNINRTAELHFVIDGNTYSTYSLAGEHTAENQQKIIFEILDLEEGGHLIDIFQLDDKPIVLDAIDIDSDGRMLSEQEYEQLVNKHLIKSNDKYYTIEEDVLTEITDTITTNLIKERGISAATLTINQSLLPDKFKLVSHKDNTFNIKTIQSHQELVVASNDFITKIQSNIDFFDVIGITDTGTSIKVAFSIDSGATWKTYDTQFKDLSITIPNKPYEELTSEELVQWNTARDIISEQGIDIANLSKIDFNTLNMEKIRFAYVISINSKDDKCCTSQLKWQFDSKGTMKSMTSDELEIELLQDSIKIVPRVSSDMIKINFSNGSTIDMTNQDNIKSLIENMSEENLNKLKEKLGI